MKTARILLFLTFPLILASACAPTPARPFLPPTAPPPSPAPSLEIRLAAPSLAPLTAPPATPTPTAAPSPTPPCENNLDFLADLTYPDGSVVAPNSRVEKQWRVKNSGNCAWTSAYRLRLVDGFSALGAAPEQALYPARAASEATLQITFTAPPEAGLYRSAWQAYDDQGLPFGQTIYIEIIVQ